MIFENVNIFNFSKNFILSLPLYRIATDGNGTSLAGQMMASNVMGAQNRRHKSLRPMTKILLICINIEKARPDREKPTHYALGKLHHASEHHALFATGTLAILSTFVVPGVPKGTPAVMTTFSPIRAILSAKA